MIHDFREPYDEVDADLVEAFVEEFEDAIDPMGRNPSLTQTEYVAGLEKSKSILDGRLLEARSALGARKSVRDAVMVFGEAGEP
jgi:hypothetical protein